MADDRGRDETTRAPEGSAPRRTRGSGALRRGRRPPRFGREEEPEGLDEAVPIAVTMIAVAAAISLAGLAWDRYSKRVAHAYAGALVVRIAADGRNTLMPVWTGTGRGPSASTAKETFDALRQLGTFTLRKSGSCQSATSFAICQGTRYRCQVLGDTPSGPVEAAIGLCGDGRSRTFGVDLVDITIPATDADAYAGNRKTVDPDLDGAIRYGTSLPLPEASKMKFHRFP